MPRRTRGELLCTASPSFACLCMLSILTSVPAQDTKKEITKKIPPQVEELLKLTPEEVIKRFDKNGDGKLSKDELPSRSSAKRSTPPTRPASARSIAPAWPRCKRCSATSSPRAISPRRRRRKRSRRSSTSCSSSSTPTATAGSHARKPRGPFIANNFDRLDLNKDGFLDRKELRALANPKGFAPQSRLRRAAV